MLPSTVLASIALALPLALLSLRIGRLLMARARADGRAALALLGMFWLGVGAYTAVDVVWTSSLLAGGESLAWGNVALQLKLLSSMTGFFGLVAYLLLILSGKRGLLVPLAIAYGMLYACAVLWYAWRSPVGHELSAWGGQLLYARDGGGPWWTSLVLAWFLPPALAALAYASLLRHLQAPEQRYRLIVVSTGFLLYFAPAPFGWIGGDWYWWPLVERALALSAMTIFYVAFAPPAWARARFGARPLMDDEAAWRLVARAPSGDVEMRARELV